MFFLYVNGNSIFFKAVDTDYTILTFTKITQDLHILINGKYRSTNQIRKETCDITLNFIS